VTARKIAVIGAGGWGTALATIWTKRGCAVSLWGKDSPRIQQLRQFRESRAYLPGIIIPSAVGLTSDLADCANADLIVFATPSTALRETAGKIRRAKINRAAVLLSCIKGIEHGTGKRMSEILTEIFPDHPIAVLSGPNLAAEVARELPTATLLACKRPEVAADLQRELSTPRFRIYTGEELGGVELGGALKNVFAIAAGAGDGLGLGDNAKAALVTRALAEMVRLGTKMGGELRTFYGLSGAGDLVATCFSHRSRNREVGEQLGRGRPLDEIISLMGTVAEGIPTAKSAYECARKLQVDTPIIDQVYSLIYERKAPARAMEDLLQREQKAEII
jgi:glycerol-3-phosphate dehydrogenase (NAD(P)+)